MSLAAPPIRAYVPIELTHGIQLAFFRTDTSQVFINLTLSEEFQNELDVHRLALIWIDNGDVLDMCDLASTGKILENINPGHVFYSCEKRSVLGVVWHGIPEQGTGFIGRIVDCNFFRIRIYFSDYSKVDFILDKSILDPWKKDIMREILGFR